ITGILHGKSASYLSELMPNTFSMAPRYVRDFAARAWLESPDRDVFDGLAAKLDRLHKAPLPTTPGLALLGDARDVAPRARQALREHRPPRRGRRARAARRSAAPRPPRRHEPALSAGREVRLLQLAPHLVAGLRRPRD